MNKNDHLAATLTGMDNRFALVFIHGLLGSGDDWQEVVDKLSADFICLTIDLPGHGQSQHIEVNGFEDTASRLIHTINAHINGPFCLVGYSLGARLSMYLSAYLFDRARELAQEETLSEINASALAACRSSLRGIIIESGDPGLPFSKRKARHANDAAWAQRFEKEPMGDVLQDWYKQPVFSSLNQEQRQKSVDLRCKNVGYKVAGMLRATSLSKQPCLLEKLKSSGLPLYYVCGQKDDRFSALRASFDCECALVEHVGHNVHAEQPELFSQLIKKWLENKHTQRNPLWPERQV